MTPWTIARQVPLPMGFSRQQYWSGLPCLPPRDLPDSGIKPAFPALAGVFFTAEPHGKPGVRFSYFVHDNLPQTLAENTTNIFSFGSGGLKSKTAGLQSCQRLQGRMFPDLFQLREALWPLPPSSKPASSFENFF